MLGTIVNASAILTGSVVGSLAGKAIPGKQHDALFSAMGLSATGLGISNIAAKMPQSKYPVLFIVSLAIGSLIGTSLDLDGRFQRLVNRSEKKNASGGADAPQKALGQGLSTAVLLFCIGTLSILGPIQSALYHDNTYLFTNATLDLVTSTVLASTYGIGIAFAAIVLFLWQGSIYLCASLLSGFLTPDFMNELSLVGGFLIFASGLSILKIKDLKTMNMLPSLLVPAVFFLIRSAI